MDSTGFSCITITLSVCQESEKLGFIYSVQAVGHLIYSIYAFKQVWFPAQTSFAAVLLFSHIERMPLDLAALCPASYLKLLQVDVSSISGDRVGFGGSWLPH